MEYTKEQLWRMKHNAPQLYEACKEVVKTYKNSPASFQPLFWLRCVQAIAKVEGDK